MSTVLRMVAATVICWQCLLLCAQAAEGEPARPDVAKMTVDQLLEEFSAREQVPSLNRRADLVNALRRQGEPLYQRLRERLRSPDERVRLSAVFVLTPLGTSAIPMVPELIRAASDPSPSVRRQAIRALGPLRDPRAFYTLIEATRDPAGMVRSATLEAAPSLSDAQFALAVLALSDKEFGVRLKAAETLKMLKDPRAVPHLVPLLDDAETQYYHVLKGGKVAIRVCDEAALALDHIVDGKLGLSSQGTQEEHDRKVEQWRQWWKENEKPSLERLYSQPDLIQRGI